MARGINKVILIGNLGADPEVRFMPSGGAVANVRVATNETWKDRQSGEQQERTEWHRVVLFGQLGELAQKYLRKGSRIYIEGRLQTRKWQGQDGQDKYSTEVRVDQMQMLGSRQGMGGPSGDDAGGGYDAPARPAARPPAAARPAAAPAPQAARSDAGFGGMDDDIPF